jgi:hypothetical protein
MQKIFAAAAAAIVLTTAGHAADALLMHSELAARVVGNTIHYQGFNEDLYEYLAPDGNIHGESTERGLYQARWRFFENDGICFVHDDPFQSGCVRLTLRKGQVRYQRPDGAIEGPFDLLPGNPRKL